MPVFDDDFIDQLSDDPDTAVSASITRLREAFPPASKAEIANDRYDEYMDAVGFVLALTRTFELEAGRFDVDANRGTNVERASNWVNRVFEASQTRLSRAILERATDRYSSRLAQGKLAVAFPEDRQVRLRALANEIKIELNKSDVLDTHHKQRLLGKVERLLGDVRKNASNLDGFWVFLGDAGVILGQSRAEVEPIVGRVREITNIVWECVAESLGSPPVPFAPPEPPPAEESEESGEPAQGTPASQ